MSINSLSVGPPLVNYEHRKQDQHWFSLSSFGGCGQAKPIVEQFARKHSTLKLRCRVYFCGLGDNPFDVPSVIGDRVSNAKKSFGFEISLGHTSRTWVILTWVNYHRWLLRRLKHRKGCSGTALPSTRLCVALGVPNQELPVPDLYHDSNWTKLVEWDSTVNGPLVG